jgi:hypothetical protein
MVSLTLCKLIFESSEQSAHYKKTTAHFPFLLVSRAPLFLFFCCSCCFLEHLCTFSSSYYHIILYYFTSILRVLYDIFYILYYTIYGTCGSSSRAVIPAVNSTHTCNIATAGHAKLPPIVFCLHALIRTKCISPCDI